MIYFPSCKINLGLHVLFKRADGYHEVETGMLEIPLRDAIEIVPSEDFRFSSSGLEIPGDDNLCVKAFRLLQRDFGLKNVHMHLHKVIPMGAGLGGGSSDAAFVLRLVNDFFKLELDDEKLESYAAELGSDCAFFIKGGLQLAKGRGEVLSPLTVQLPHLWIVLINPGIHVSTQQAFAGISPDNNRRELEKVLRLPIGEWKDRLTNDFEKSIFPAYPEIAAIKQQLYNKGAIYASMSGSGSTVFGLFAEKPQTDWSEYAFTKVLELKP